MSINVKLYTYLESYLIFLYFVLNVFVIVILTAWLLWLAIPLSNIHSKDNRGSKFLNSKVNRQDRYAWLYTKRIDPIDRYRLEVDGYVSNKDEAISLTICGIWGSGWLSLQDPAMSLWWNHYKIKTKYAFDLLYRRWLILFSLVRVSSTCLYIVYRRLIV